MPERAMLKNKLVFVTKEHFMKMLYSCAVVGGEKGTLQDLEAATFPSPPYHSAIAKLEMLSREGWKRSKVTKNLPEEVASCVASLAC